ncbi:MAG: ABC transporter substrate-binding protein [Pseudomonadota bacterium]
MKRMSWAVAVLFLVAALAGWGAGTARAEVGVTADTIKLGTFQDMSGPGAYLGRMCTTSLDIWMKYVNNQLGGIHGRKLELVVEDNKYDPELTKTAFTKLVDKHQVFAIVLVYGSGPCVAVKEDITKAKVPVFPTMATVDSMFEPPSRYLYWYACNDADNAIMMVDFIKDDLKIGTKDAVIGVCYQDDEWGKSALKGAEIAGEKYGYKVVAAPYKKGSKNLSPEVMKMKAAGVTHCFYAGYAPVYAMLLKEANKVGWKPTFFGDYVTVDPRTFAAGQLADGHYHFFNVGLRSEKTPGWQEIEKLFNDAGAQELLNVPLIPLLWNSLTFLTKALQDAGPDLTREKLIDALDSIKGFDTKGNGEIEYGPNIRKGTHKYRVLKCDAANQIFVPITDWREPSIK